MQPDPVAEQQTRTFLLNLRIIVCSLAMGLAAFAGFILTMQPPQQRDGNLGPLMAGFAGTIVLVRIIVPGVLFRVQRQKIAAGTWPASGLPTPVPATDEGKLLLALQTKTIVGCALLEGAGFANLFAYMQERQWYNLLIAGLLCAGILVMFPLRGAVDAWLSDQVRWLHDERTLRRSER